jgi:hypothetical protein
MTNAKRRRPRLTMARKLSPLLLAGAIVAAGTTAWATQSSSTSSDVIVDSLSVSTTSGGQFKATATLHSNRSLKVQELAVEARSENGGNYDFPGATAAKLSSSETTYTSGSRTFPTGTYTYFVAYKTQGIWHSLSPVQTFTSGSTSASPSPTTSTSPAPTSSSSPSPTATATPTAGQTTTSTSDVPVGIPGSWRKVFGDEFSGSTLDSTKWNPNWLGCSTCTTKPVNSAELSAYAPSQVSVNGGSLHLTAVQQQTTVNGTSYPYRSGLVESNGKAQFTYGAFEARIYTPGSGSQIANWPAFWTDGQNWPTDGEMDVMEGLSGGKACYHFHSDAGGPGGCASGDFTGWHTYGAEWKPGAVTYYYDGKQVGQITTGITSQPMYLILNNAVSDQHGGPIMTPADMMVDYVRVWQH